MLGLLSNTKIEKSAYNRNYICLDLLLGTSDKLFELAVMKVMKGEELNAKESNKVAKLRKTHAIPADGMSNDSSEECLENSDGAVSSEHQQNYADLIQKRIKWRKHVVRSINENYICLDLLLGTSVSCERLFSIAKHILTCVRKSTSPAVFEAILFLKMNRHYWNEVVVSKAMGRTITLEMDDDQVD